MADGDAMADDGALPFYRHGGFVAAMVAMIAIVAATASLGFWQLDRAAEKLALQAQRDRAGAQPPVSLASVSGSSASGASAAGGSEAGAPANAKRMQDLDGNKVTIEGIFVPSKAVFLDNRTRDGISGFEVLMPLQLTGGNRVVVVMRGWVAGNPRDRNQVPDVMTPGGVVRLEGLAMAELPQPIVLSAASVPGPGGRIWQHFDFEAYERWSGREIVPLIVRQIGDADWLDRLNRQWIQPGSGVDKHRAYAVQWFAMSAMAALFACGLLARFWRARRNETGNDAKAGEQSS